MGNGEWTNSHPVTKKLKKKSKNENGFLDVDVSHYQGSKILNEDSKKSLFCIEIYAIYFCIKKLAFLCQIVLSIRSSEINNVFILKEKNYPFTR